MTQSPELSTDFKKASDRFADGMAHICRLYGINPLLGRLYAALFVSAEPMSLTRLCEHIGAAKSTTSVVLRRLLSLRLVRRLPPHADRRDFYEVVPDLWAVLRDWNQTYFQPELAMWRRSSAELERALKASESSPAHEVLQARLTALDEVVRFTAEVLGGVPASGAPVSSAPAVTIAIEEES